MRNLPLIQPMNRQGALPEASNKPWFRIVNKAKDDVTKVYIYDVIGGWFGVDVQDFVKELNDIETDEIHVHINSPGGSVYDGISIYNTLRQHDSTVHTYIDGLAASAASFIAQAGEKVIMGRNATMMIHDAIGACYGNRADMLMTADLLDKVSNNIADIYAKNAGGTSDEWRALMKEETWYTGQEALDAGLATEVLDLDEEDTDTSNSWDLSKFFNYAGREKAPSPKELREKVHNQLKEASMAGKVAPKNTSEPGTEAPTEPETDPVEPVAPAEPETDAPEEPTNKASFSVLINGVATSSTKDVQNHINSLEMFRRETIETARIEFVENLSRDNKIVATQVGSKAEGDNPATGLIAFSLGLTDEQFTNWKASYDAAPSLSMFDPHGITPGNEGRPGSGAPATADEIKVLEDIVADHRRTGMPQAQIETKDSWKRLQALKSTQTTK